MILYRSVQTRFRFGSETVSLNLASHRNSPARSTKSTTSHACGALSACKHTVSGSISLPSRGSFHLSLTVLFASGHMVVFSLMRWSSYLPSGFLVSRRTPDSARLLINVGYRSVTFFGAAFQPTSPTESNTTSRSLPRRYYYLRFGLLRFRSPLLSESLSYFLFLRVLRCFSSPGSPPYAMDLHKDNALLTH